MAEFDPAMKAETWIFEIIGKDAKGRTMYRRLPYNKVEYDGDPECVMEPVAGAGFKETSADLLTPKPGITEGYCIGFEIVNGFDDVNQAFAIGQTIGI